MAEEQRLDVDSWQHERWVKKGHCPAISPRKEWCSKRPGHTGLHGSPLQLPPEYFGQFPKFKWVEWEK